MFNTEAAGDWYDRWVSFHCRSTGVGESSVDAVIDLFNVNRLLVSAEPWFATEEELHACTRRLVAACRPPQFVNEHLKLIGLELIALRAERDATTAQKRRDETPATDCAFCSGSGWVSVPHPQCVWNGRLVLHPANNRVCTVAVTCDACPAGRTERDREADRASRHNNKHHRRPTHAEYTRVIHGHDGLAMLAAHQKQQAADGRRYGESDYGKLLSRVIQRAKASNPSDEAA